MLLSYKPDIIIYGYYEPDEGDCREIYVRGIWLNAVYFHLK